MGSWWWIILNMLELSGFSWIGTQTSAIMYWWSNPSSLQHSNTEKYDGSSWTECK